MSESLPFSADGSEAALASGLEEHEPGGDAHVEALHRRREGDAQPDRCPADDLLGET